MLAEQNLATTGGEGRAPAHVLLVHCLLHSAGLRTRATGPPCGAGQAVQLPGGWWELQLMYRRGRSLPYTSIQESGGDVPDYTVQLGELRTAA